MPYERYRISIRYFGCKATYFKPLIRNAQQVNILKEPEQNALGACWKALKFSLVSHITFVYKFGLGVIIPNLKSDCALVLNLPSIMRHRNPIKLQQSIQRQISIDTMVDAPSGGAVKDRQPLILGHEQQQTEISN